mmetsp:Transcript_6372/g.16275  ORF Transcript_6372/g.16275 Transcript_6372/m.16275 type:complete len:264 (+) Transcript_6372:776-1567(+)
MGSSCQCEPLAGQHSASQARYGPASSAGLKRMDRATPAPLAMAASSSGPPNRSTRSATQLRAKDSAASSPMVAARRVLHLPSLGNLATMYSLTRGRSGATLRAAARSASGQAGGSLSSRPPTIRAAGVSRRRRPQPANRIASAQTLASQSAAAPGGSPGLPTAHSAPMRPWNARHASMASATPRGPAATSPANRAPRSMPDGPRAACPSCWSSTSPLAGSTRTLAGRRSPCTNASRMVAARSRQAAMARRQARLAPAWARSSP